MGEILKFGDRFLRNRFPAWEDVLENLSETRVDELFDKAKKEGMSQYELAAELEITLLELTMMRRKSPEFDRLVEQLLTATLAKVLAASKQGIQNPKFFSSGAFDRYSTGMGYSPIVHEVKIHKDEGPKESAFDLKAFQQKYERHGPAIIDITAEADELSTEETAELEDLL